MVVSWCFSEQRYCEKHDNTSYQQSILVMVDDNFIFPLRLMPLFLCFAEALVIFLTFRQTGTRSRKGIPCRVRTWRIASDCQAATVYTTSIFECQILFNTVGNGLFLMSKHFYRVDFARLVRCCILFNTNSWLFKAFQTRLATFCPQVQNASFLHPAPLGQAFQWLQREAPLCSWTHRATHIVALDSVSIQPSPAPPLYQRGSWVKPKTIPFASFACATNFEQLKKSKAQPSAQHLDDSNWCRESKLAEGVVAKGRDALSIPAKKRGNNNYMTQKTHDLFF